MRLTTQDAAGIVFVAGTLGALALHNAPTGHRDSHVSPIADAGGSVTSSVAVSTIAFVDVNVVPMGRDEVLRRKVVIVREGFVTRVGDVGVLEPPPGAVLIDGHGTQYLAPGLTDAHVHLGDDPESLLPLFIANGVTTVFNMQGDTRHLALRERIATGDVVGPTIYTAGPFIDEDLIRSAADARRAVRRQKTSGYDFVKLHGDLSEESFEMLTRTGHEQRIAIVGHAPRNLPLSAVLDNGQAALTHAEEIIYTRFMSLEPADLSNVATTMADAGTWLTPGLSHFGNTVSQWGDPAGLQAALERRSARFLPPSMRRGWESSDAYVEKDPRGRGRLEEMLAFHDPLISTFHDAGVPMLTGTDAGLPGMVPGFSLHGEIVALNGVGLSRYEALAAATRNAGSFVRQRVDELASFGTVQVGARADLILLDGDPRTSLDALLRPEGVMVRGRWFDRAALDLMLPGVSEGR